MPRSWSSRCDMSGGFMAFNEPVPRIRCLHPLGWIRKLTGPVVLNSFDRFYGQSCFIDPNMQFRFSVMLGGNLINQDLSFHQFSDRRPEIIQISTRNLGGERSIATVPVYEPPACEEHGL